MISRIKSNNSVIIDPGLGKRIEKRLSKLPNKTQLGLSKYIPVSENMIKNWKTGTEPGAYKFHRMCEYLECDSLWLLRGDGDPNIKESTGDPLYKPCEKTYISEFYGLNEKLNSFRRKQIINIACVLYNIKICELAEKDNEKNKQRIESVEN